MYGGPGGQSTPPNAGRSVCNASESPITEASDFGESHPGPSDVALVAEVTDSSLPRDRIVKKRVYAAAGIAVYWVVNLVDRQIEVYTDCTNPPPEPDYARCGVYTLADNVPLVVDGRTVAEIPVRAILPE